MAALDSLGALGLGEGPSDGAAEGAAVGGPAESAGAVAAAEEVEEEVSDAELLEAARLDPDLAALLRGEAVGGLDLDRELDRRVGGGGGRGAGGAVQACGAEGACGSGCCGVAAQ